MSYTIELVGADSIDLATFSPDSCHVAICRNHARSTLLSLNHHGVWEDQDTTRNSCSENCIQPCDQFRYQTTRFSIEGSLLMLTFHAGVTKLITLNSQGKLAKKATIEDDWIESAVFSLEGRHLVTTTRDKVLVFEILPFYPEDPPNS